MKRSVLLIVISFMTGVMALGLYITRPIPTSRLDETARILRAQNGAILDLRLTKSGHWREKVEYQEIDETLVKILVAYEDKRYWAHGGVDFYAISRSIYDFFKNRRVISGASTLTMQTVRLMYPRLREKTFLTKIHQMLFALRLEYHWTKEQILSAYFTLAPYGGNLEGIKAAAWGWLKRNPSTLTINEAAFLVALPQSPERRRPDKFPERAHIAKNRVLFAVKDELKLSSKALAEYQSEFLPIKIMKLEPTARHLMDRLSKTQSKSEYITSLNAYWQKTTEAILANEISARPIPINAAAIILERSTGFVRAYVGSENYLSSARKGAINYLTANRSPGSTLKPLIYAHAMDRNLISIHQVFDDAVFQRAGYAPTNFDKTYTGKTSLKDALIKSLNIPAILTLEAIGINIFENLIRNFLGGKENNPKNAGLSLAVGGFYLTPEELAVIYLEIADPGSSRNLNFLIDSHSQTRTALISEKASRNILALLLQHNQSGKPFLAKTGTSHRRQDAWVVEITEKHIVLVWLGTPDNEYTSDLTGASAALPLSRRIIRALDLRPPKVTKLTSGSISELQIEKMCPVLITYPEDGERLRVSEMFIAVNTTEPNTNWYINGKPVYLEDGNIQLPHVGVNKITAKNGKCTEIVEVFVEPLLLP
jgi:penicillin-binding protein 1C